MHPMIESETSRARALAVIETAMNQGGPSLSIKTRLNKRDTGMIPGTQMARRLELGEGNDEQPENTNAPF